jgi:hypothetical protein
VFKPHVQIVPLVLSAIICPLPDIAFNQLVPPATVCTGDEVVVTLLVPKTPKVFKPQHQSVPSVFIPTAY